MSVGRSRPIRTVAAFSIIRKTIGWPLASWSDWAIGIPIFRHSRNSSATRRIQKSADSFVMAVGTTAGAGFSGFLPVLGPLLTAVFVSYACAAALAMVIGARWVFPVQPPGTSPLATKGTGQFMTTALIQSLELVGGALLAAPALGLLAAGLWGPLPWWVAVPVALAWSVAALW